MSLGKTVFFLTLFIDFLLPISFTSMRQVVRALLQNEEEKYLLVIHQKADTWTTPWGHIDPGETLHQALKREIKEEFNLKIQFLWSRVDLEIEHIHEQVLPLAMYKIKYTSKKFGKTKKCEYIFHARVKDIENLKVQEDEIKEYKWFTLEEIYKLEDVFPQVPKLLKQIHV